MLSRDNRLVKNALKLKQRKYREQQGRFLVEGIRFIEEGLKEGVVDYILYSRKLYRVNGSESILSSEVDKFEIDEPLIKELSETENPQGAVAVVRKQSYALEDIEGDFIVIADGVQDPGNLGTIIRTSDAAGASAVILIKGTVDVYNSKTLRATMGSVFHMPILHFDDFEGLCSILKNRGFNIYASSLDVEDYIYASDFKGKTAIIIGNEANGIPEEHINLATHKIKIPMQGRAESLNAASAAAIIIYEVVRQRLYK
ncbi:TrmH family RNA methyltransferase [Fonticella tunisiensis]|uniref:TrmH family RNA methyltransferase n=1 Tax=Fonticella tunisiensis TaxID=1096341 RepID=A0A4R7KR16_9CLOT|nr:RNA methyltransferase [Fonticella tunisiensis]TDT61043.1 TrmH family RNA methyltransferase [Fonticella tunisiensis]